MMDWLGQLLGLPKEFLTSPEGTGGGVIQVRSPGPLVYVIYLRQ